MNYKSELRGFALDRATKLIEIKAESGSVTEVADKLVEYLYIPEKDIDSHLQTLFPLVRASGDLEKISHIILAFSQMESELEAGVNTNVN